MSPPQAGDPPIVEGELSEAETVEVDHSPSEVNPAP